MTVTTSTEFLEACRLNEICIAVTDDQPSVIMWCWTEDVAWMDLFSEYYRRGESFRLQAQP